MPSVHGLKKSELYENFLKYCGFDAFTWGTHHVIIAHVLHTIRITIFSTFLIPIPDRYDARCQLHDTSIVSRKEESHDGRVVRAGVSVT